MGPTDEDMAEIVARLRSSLGLRGKAMVKPIEKGALLKFCAAVGETEPLHLDETYAQSRGYRGLVAPPTYLSVFSEACGEVLCRDIPFTRFLHTDDAITAHVPICAGDIITATPLLADVFAKRSSRGTLLFQAADIALTNQHGELAASLRVTTAFHE
jgi:acyl dehydratase